MSFMVRQTMSDFDALQVASAMETAGATVISIVWTGNIMGFQIFARANGVDLNVIDAEIRRMRGVQTTGAGNDLYRRF